MRHYTRHNLFKTSRVLSPNEKQLARIMGVRMLDGTLVFITPHQAGLFAKYLRKMEAQDHARRLEALDD